MAEAAVSSSTLVFLFLGEALALRVAADFPPDAAKTLLLTGARTFNIRVQYLELAGHLHPLDLQPHMPSFWNVHDPHATLQIDWETSEVRRSVTPNVVQCASFEEWCWSSDSNKIQQLSQEHAKLREEIVAAHQAGQLSPSSCVVSGVQFCRADVEELLRRCGRPVVPTSATADVADPTKPPEDSKEWLPWVKAKYPRRSGERLTAYAKRLWPHAPVTVRQSWKDAETLRKRLYDC